MDPGILLELSGEEFWLAAHVTPPRRSFGQNLKILASAKINSDFFFFLLSFYQARSLSPN